MKKILTLCLVSFVALSSVGASAFTKVSLESIKEMQHTGFWFDKDTQQDYYFENGELVKEKIIDINNSKYYANTDGIIIKGWKLINNNWYHFSNTSEKMNTGWLLDGSTWYYLNQDGTMAHDTYVGSYYLGSNGAWIK